jgi:hypothetical protein
MAVDLVIDVENYGQARALIGASADLNWAIVDCAW